MWGETDSDKINVVYEEIRSVAYNHKLDWDKYRSITLLQCKNKGDNQGVVYIFERCQELEKYSTPT
jgi:hypothetical protein